jgi:ribosome-associated translation inhibitor RaiA
MNIDITARGFSLSDSLKSFVNEKSLLLKKYDSNISSAKIVLIKEGRAEKIELIVSSKKN